jgi:hypothetical protein
MMQDELDRNLCSLFQERRNSLTEEPFLGDMLKLIKRKRARLVFAQGVVFIPAICFIALLSPYLLKGSALISDVTNALFEICGNFMVSPRGIACAAFCAFLVFVFKRRWFSALI